METNTPGMLGQTRELHVETWGEWWADLWKDQGAELVFMALLFLGCSAVGGAVGALVVLWLR